jgi:hypothetical protein
MEIQGIKPVGIQVYLSFSAEEVEAIHDFCKYSLGLHKKAFPDAPYLGFVEESFVENLRYLLEEIDKVGG